MIPNKITDLIGNTPVLSLQLKNTKWKLILKLEKYNPWQSMKDRMALSMVNHAELNWYLKPWGTIIESSSGNTAIWLSIVSAQKGYKFIAIVDHHTAKNKIAIMKAYWAEIVYVYSNKGDWHVAVQEREILAKKMSTEIPNSYRTNQADNPANSQWYYDTLWNELIYQIDWKLDIFIWSIWTWWSLCGTARRLKENNKSINVYWVEPIGSVIFWGKDWPYYQSGSWNPGNVEIAQNIDYDIIDKWYKVSDKDAFTTAIFLAKKKWILVWWTSWGVLYQAIKIITWLPWVWTMCAILPDWWEKYLDTIFNEDWIKNKKLYNKNTEKILLDAII